MVQTEDRLKVADRTDSSRSLEHLVDYQEKVNQQIFKEKKTLQLHKFAVCHKMAVWIFYCFIKDIFDEESDSKAYGRCIVLQKKKNQKNQKNPS